MPDQRQYDVFLSHNRDDQTAVELIARRLREEAKLRPFLDRWHLVPGAPWQEAIEGALENSEAIAVFVGPSGISPWHNEEMRAGLDRTVRTRDDVRVIPVLLPGAVPQSLPAFLARRSSIDFRTGLDDVDAFARLVAGVLGQPPDQAGAHDLPDQPAPYPSLLPFTAQQSQFFFGRNEERDRLLGRVRESAFVAVVGASGSGKSSLVLAGLLPSIGKNWQVLTLVPGARPLRALADQVASFFAPKDRLLVADRLEKRFSGRTDGLSTAISNLLADRPNIATLLVVVDQFEEVFTQTLGTSDEAQRHQQAFIDNLVDTVQVSADRVRVVITLRADFLQPCLGFPGLRGLLESNQLLLGPLGEDALREAIVKPAQAVGALFQKGLVRSLMNDMRGQSAALPLLQFALAQLWQRRRGVWLTHEAYEDIDGVRGAINKLADAVYCQLKPAQQRLARNLFVRLVAFGEGTGNTRRRVRRDELRLIGGNETEVKRLIGLFSHRDVRLIATDADTVELAHEAVIEEWKQLRDWLEEDRAALLTHRRLTDATEQWQSDPQDESYSKVTKIVNGLPPCRPQCCDLRFTTNVGLLYLYQGTPLFEAIEWAETHGEEMNVGERAFLDASLALRERAAQEQEAQRQRELENERKLTEAANARAAAEQRNVSRLRVFLAVGGILLIAAIAAAGLAVINAQEANNQSAIAVINAQEANEQRVKADQAAEQAAKARDIAQHEARISSAQARGGDALLELEQDNSDRGLLLARAAVVTDTETQSVLASRAFQEALAATLPVTLPVRRLENFEGSAEAVAWSSDSQQVLIANRNVVQVWDVTTGKQLSPLASPPPGITVTALAWHPREKKLLTGSPDGFARIWDMATNDANERPVEWHPHDRSVSHVEWSPDGQQVLTYDGQKTRIWDLSSAEPLSSTIPMKFEFSSSKPAVWSKDGSQMLTVQLEAGLRIRVWNAATWEEIPDQEQFIPAPTAEKVAWSLDRQKRLFGSCRGKHTFSSLVLTRHKAMREKRFMADVVKKQGELIQVFLMR